MSSSRIDLSWAAGAGATTYTVKRATTSAGPYTAIARGLSETTYSSLGLSGATTYYYVVSAVNDGGESPDSAPASATTASTAPVITSSLSATGTTGNPISYQITATATNPPLSYSATGLPAGLTLDPGTGLISGSVATDNLYPIQLTATDALNLTDTKTLQLRVWPFFLSAVATSYNQVSVSWPASSGPVSYTLKRATVSGGPYSTVASALTTTSHLDSGLAPNTTYYYQVAVVSGGAEVNQSNEGDAKTHSGVSTTLIQDSFTTASATVVGRLPQEATIESRAYQKVPGGSTQANSVSGGFASLTTAIGTVVALGNGTTYTKPAEFKITATFNMGSIINNNPTRPGRGVMIGFWTTIPGGTGDPMANMRGIIVNPEDGELHLWNGGASSTSVPSQSLPYNGAWGGGAHTLAYTINTTTGDIANCVLDGKAYYWNTTSVFTNVANFGGFAVCANGSNRPGNIDSFLLQGIGGLPPVITSGATAAGTVGAPFSYTLTASNTPTTYGATGLPAGVSINTTTGLISGTPATAGTFNASLTASNATGTGTASLTLTVAGRSYVSWAAAKGLTASNNAAGADPEGDGIANQLEFILGLNPLVPDVTGLPTLTREGANFVFRFVHDKTVDGTFTVEQSTDLLAWNAIPTTVESSTATTETLAALLPMTMPKQFMRLVSEGVATPGD